MRSALYAVAALLLGAVIVYSATVYVPRGPAPDPPTARRLLEGAKTYGAWDGQASVLLKSALGPKDAPITDINFTDTSATIANPTIRVQGNQLILTVTVTSITNSANEDIAFGDVCGGLSAPEGHQLAAVPYVFVNTFDSIPGYSSHYGNLWWGGTWAYDAQDSTKIVSGGPADRRLRHSQTSWLLKGADCHAGDSADARLPLKTDFPSRTVPAGLTRTYSAQNTIEFVIPPAPSFVSADGRLEDSAYPFTFGGIYLISTDFRHATYIPLS